MANTTTPPAPALQSFVPPDLRLILNTFGIEVTKNLNCVRVGIIESFNAANQTAVIQIAQLKVTSTLPNGTALGARTFAPYAPLAQVPVIFPSGGGYTLTFPIKAGDECVVIFNDRELDNWKNSGSGQPPNTPRLHNLSDGFALVGVRNFTRSLGTVSTTTTQLRSDDGATVVEVDGTGQIVTLTAPVKIRLNSPIVEVAGAVSVLNENSVADPCTIAGNVLVTGGDVVADGINLKTHVHTGVMNGSGNTGAPVG